MALKQEAMGLLESLGADVLYTGIGKVNAAYALTRELTVDCQVLDMEAYALAKVCRAENVPFAAVKYITDGADADAAEHWPERLRHAAEAFAEFTQAHFRPASLHN